jgi:hypothetical protein
LMPYFVETGRSHPWSPDFTITFIEFSSKSPCLWASFHPLSPLWVRSSKQGNFIRFGYVMLKLSL